jgi:oligopeptide transport system substrate-binding protein
VRIEEIRMKGSGRSQAPGISRRDFLKIGGTGLAGAAMLGVPGCGVFSGGGGGGGGGSSKSVTINLGDTIRDLDSTTTTDSVSVDVLENVVSGLMRLDPDNRPVPELAESYEISSDKLTYTFKLRDGIKWSNGDPVTSQDFKYAWLRALDPKTAGQYAYIITTFVKGASEFNSGKGSADDVAIETPDDKTLKVTLVAPSPFWLGLAAFFTYLPQNQKFVEQQGDNYAQNTEGLLYNGPYILTQLNPTQGVTMVKNKDYWDADNVEIQKVEGKIVKELETAVNLYDSGDLDDTEISGEYVTQYKGKPDFWSQTYFATFYLVPNYELKIFQNLNIRRALQMSFDPKTLVNKILNDGSQAATGLVPDGIAGPGDQTFREAEGTTAPGYDPDKAKELFQKGLQEVGENPTIEFLTYDDSTARDIATFLQSQLEKMGAKISVKVQPFDRKLELESNGQFQLSWQGWIADYDDPMTFLDLFESSSSFNTQKYKNAEYDKLISGAREETDFAKRMDMLLEAEKVLVKDDAATAPIYFEGEAHLVRPTITKYVDHQYGAGADVKWWKVS